MLTNQQTNMYVPICSTILCSLESISHNIRTICHYDTAEMVPSSLRVWAWVAVFHGPHLCMLSYQILSVVITYRIVHCVSFVVNIFIQLLPAFSK